jgi:hypothetical protein
MDTIKKLLFNNLIAFPKKWAQNDNEDPLEFYTHVTEHRDKFLDNKTNKTH